MLEDIRRQLAHRKAEKEKEKLRKIEVERRLSYITMKRLETRKLAEEELREQKASEIGLITETRRAQVERQRAEKELRRMTPGLGRRMARVTKKALYDVPVKTVRALSRPETGEKIRKVIIGDPSIFAGRKQPTEHRKPEQSLTDFLYGTPNKGKDKDITRDILS